MKLETFVEMIKSKTDELNPEIRFLPLSPGSMDDLEVDCHIEVLNKYEYFSESFFGKVMPVDNFVVVEIG